MPKRTRLAWTCFLIAMPGALAAEDTRPTSPELRPAYCAGYFDAEEQFIGDTCIDAEAGWENGCSEISRHKKQSLAQQPAGDPRNGVAMQTGYTDYQQCRAEVTSAAAVAHTLECTKQFTGPQLSLCISSGPATPACQRLLQCDE